MESRKMSKPKVEDRDVKGNKKEGLSTTFLRRCLTHMFRQFAIVIMVYVTAMSVEGLAQIVSPEVMKVSERFVCQCGCSEQLSVCAMLNCGSATPLRAEIAELLKQGKTEKEITEIFVAKYGKVILAAPTTQGFDLTAWTLPFVMLVLGLVLIYYLIRLWAKPRVASVAGAGNSAGVPQDYQQRIESELKDLDS